MNTSDDQSAESPETDVLLRSLREHRRVIEADRPDVPLPKGVTHVLVRGPGSVASRLVERRKSSF